ncbi:L-lysine 6-oxidase [Grifola frondosa]|uniref:L-lysine 6-oxidase n=1 Tax=Grifola frondosa TaxID=5627 RepID=A0A1C7MR41_GRIFR|nr:L-lysine 6-oxidase [Grifola frondosa]
MAPFVPYDPSQGWSYQNVPPEQIARVEIFPPIGIARVGDSGSLPGGEEDTSSEIEYYYGPEVPGSYGTPVPGGSEQPFGSFRDGEQRIRRQAARFRVYAYDKNGKALGEINNASNYTMNWVVHVANKKAASYMFRGRTETAQAELRNPDVDSVDTPLSGDPFDTSLENRTSLIIDPGERSIKRDPSGGNPQPVKLIGSFQGSKPAGEKPLPGRLVFLGGRGFSRSIQAPAFDPPEIISEMDSIDWMDDICDGWIDVIVSHPNRPGLSKEITRPHKATIIAAPPKFAWNMQLPTSLYDVVENYTKPNIWPVLAGMYKLSWVNKFAYRGHGPNGFGNFAAMEKELSSVPTSADKNKNLRQHIFDRLRVPNFKNKDMAGEKFMPRLSGDSGMSSLVFVTMSLRDHIRASHRRRARARCAAHRERDRALAALTELQYQRFTNWKDGKFTATPIKPKKCIEEYGIELQPAELTRAALEQTVGDPLYPGIEVFWIAKLSDTVNHDKVLPGFLSRGLCLPWQSDFSQCNTHWWPSARPDDVIPDKYVYDAKMKNLEGNDLAAFLGEFERSSWTRGIRETPDNDTFFPGSTDMVTMWTGLGFIVKVQDKADELPVYVESERLMGGAEFFSP